MTSPPTDNGVTLVIRHTTRFDYSAPVTQAHSEVRKTPVDTPLQQVRECSLSVHPNVIARPHDDHFGNRVHHFNLLEPHQHVEIVSESVVTTTNALLSPQPTTDDSDRRPPEERWAEFLSASPGVPPLPDYAGVPLADTLAGSSDDFQSGVQQLAGYFFDTFRYDPDVTHVHSTPAELFEHGGGVCQDMAHAMIGVLRARSIPARYVSGYIHDPKQDEDGQHLRGSAATHAWVQTWHPGTGWLGVDPTNNKLVDWQYVLVAIGRDYFDVQPVRGVFMGSGTQQLTVSVSVTRQSPSPA